MNQQTWKCINCGKKFDIGKWTCEDGTSNHVVDSKEYLLADAPSDPGHPVQGGVDSLRDGRTRICNIPPDRTVLRNNEATVIPGGYVEFIRGRFSTTDPEIQYYLEKTRGKHFVNEAQWAAAWLSQSQQFELERGRLSAMAQRLENERNELLAQTKQRVANG
jgi:hypothetical protein